MSARITAVQSSEDLNTFYCGSHVGGQKNAHQPNLSYVYISSYKHLTLTGISYNASRLLNKNITKLKITLNYQRLSSKFGDNNWLVPRKDTKLGREMDRIFGDYTET